MQELITLFMGLMVYLDNAQVEPNTERNLLWEKPDGTKFLAPTALQAAQYVAKLKGRTIELGIAGGIWKDMNECKKNAMEAFQHFLIDQEKQSLAARLRETATKLESGTAHISPPTPKIGYRAPSAAQKRKREDDFQVLEETLLEASQVVRDFKKVERSYQPLQMGASARENIPSAASYSAPSTRPSAGILLSPEYAPKTQVKMPEERLLSKLKSRVQQRRPM